MKKFITVAALVAAGTALASADTVLISNGTATAGSTLSDLGITDTYNYASYSWCVSFTLDTSSGFGGTLVFVLDNTIADGTDDKNLGILVNANLGRLNIANSNSVHLGTPDSNGSAVFDTSAGTLDLSLSWDADNKLMTLSTTTTTDGETYSTVLQLGEDATHKEYTQYASLSGDSAFRLAASNVTITVSSTSDVPEPSMFGLLAGLGAIGLVVTRRRRNRKA